MTTIHNILKQYWGFDSFRPLQEDIIRWSLQDQDALALLPTGGGKSLCFQVPALAREGVCVVVSPLIALMKDQVQNLNKRGIPAIAIFSGMRHQEIDQALDNVVFGKTKFLYVSPERLATPLFQARIQKMNLNLIAIDEAHCISQWGYDFRPAYLNIAEIRKLKPDTPILALTATATPVVVKDIQEKLLFPKKKVFQKSFLRDNISYSVFEESAKLNRLLKVLKGVPGSSVVYVRSRRRCKEISLFLQRNQISADYYHAGLNHEQRNTKQTEWIEGKTRVIVATNAFGMGIDKPDVRTVIHMDLPNNLEAYFQEAGRAGRDGEKAFAVLLYQDEDLNRLSFQHEKQYPEFEFLKRVYSALGNFYQLAVGSGDMESFDFDLAAFSERFGFKSIDVFHAIKVLQDEGWIELTESVFVPAKVKIRVSKEELYSYQLENPGMELLIKTILRTSPGIFNHQSRIVESQLAFFLKIPTDRVSHRLKKMQKEGILEYEEQKDQPQLFWLQERIPSENFTIDHERLNRLKTRSLERIESVRSYVKTSEICRSKQLLSYFGEVDSPSCGICDVCLEQKKNFSEKDIENAIETLLKQKALSLEDLIKHLAKFPKNLIVDYINFAVQEGRIRLSDQQLLSWHS